MTRDRKVLVGVILGVLVVWLVGAAVTKYDLGQMALLAPIAVIVVGATAAIVILWTKNVLQAFPSRR
jgi:flagellar motor component MotA